MKRAIKCGFLILAMFFGVGIFHFMITSSDTFRSDMFAVIRANGSLHKLFDTSTAKEEELPAYPKLLLYDQSVCEGRDNLTLIYVYSSAAKRESRDIIRETYGSKSVQEKWNIKLVFLLGIAQKNKSQHFIPISLIEEYHLYTDLVIGDFIDSYRNLSYKGLAAFNFITHYCSNAHHAIKTDDDVIVNVDLIMMWLRGFYHGDTRSIYGHYHSSHAPSVCPSYPKWCVNRTVYKRKLHPRYMSGVGIVYTTDIIADLYKASLEIPIFHVDDVYMTGLLGERVKNKNMIDWAKYIPYGAGLTECQERKSSMVFAHAHESGTEILRQCWAAFQKHS